MTTYDTPTVGVPEGFNSDPEKIAAVKQRLISAGVKYCYATFVDIHGVPKSKITPLASFESMCNGHELYTVGANEGLGLAGPHEDECATVPDLDSCIIPPWNNTKAWFSANLYYHGGKYRNDPRSILQSVLQRAANMGYSFNLGIEPEFYVLRRNSEGELVPLSGSMFKGPNACYDVRQATESSAFLEPMADYIEQLGWGLYSFDQECGRGQYEFDFDYADALKMADRFVFLRFMARQVARSIDAEVTYMPKPFANEFRSGAHFNMSLADIGTGKNLFAPESGSNRLMQQYDAPMSDLAYHFTAGVLRHAAAITALACPTYNSYQGLIAQGALADFSWAPILVVWGVNNRSAMLRLPLNRHCLENRAVDMSCNPYLAAALQLAAGLEGIVHEYDPREPINKDVYGMSRTALKQASINTLPPTLLHALEAFEADSLVEETFGPEFKQLFIDQKMREWNQSFFQVSEQQREEMFDYI